jgi:hypothetical protein
MFDVFAGIAFLGAGRGHGAVSRDEFLLLNRNKRAVSATHCEKNKKKNLKKYCFS